MGNTKGQDKADVKDEAKPKRKTLTLEERAAKAKADADRLEQQVAERKTKRVTELQTQRSKLVARRDALNSQIKGVESEIERLLPPAEDTAS